MNPNWREYGAPLVPATSAGPLDGIGVAVKDLFAVAGYRIGAGNPTWLAQAAIEPADAWAVQAVRAAGAHIVGIAQTDELAFSLSGTNAHYGTPPNPAAPGLIPGGSSSGPAAAVASKLADVGLGTDTAGSIRVPASVCGLYGLRPTHGAVLIDGVLELARSFDTVGWLARDPTVLSAVGTVLLRAGQTGAPARLLCLAAAAVADSRRVADALGIDLLIGSPPGLDRPDAVTDLVTAFRIVQSAEAWRARGEWISANPGVLASDVEARFRAGATVDDDTDRRARKLIALRRAQLVDVLAERTWLALPATAGPGHALAADASTRDAWRQATLRCTVPASAFGLPSCVLPGTASPPAGLALVGPPGDDLALLDAAVRVADATQSTPMSGL